MQPLSKEVVIFSNIFGGFPLKFTIDSKDRKRKLKFSFFVFFWGLVLITLQTILSAIGVYTDFSKRVADQPKWMFNDKSGFVTLIDFLSFNLTLVVVFFSCARKYQHFVSVLQILEHVDQNLHQNVLEVKAKAKVSFIFIVTTGLFVYSSLLGYTKFVKLDYKDYIKSIFYVLPLSSCFAQVSMFLHFTQVTQSVATRFGIINAKVKEEVMRNMRRRKINSQCLPSVNVPQSDRGLSSIWKIKSLMKTYWELCDAVHQANTFYGDQLMVIFFNSFAHITISLYYFSYSVIYEDTIITVLMGTWSIAHVAYLVLLVHPSTLVTKLAAETAPVICKLINMDLDPALVKCLEEFLLQLGKHKPRLSALGFFHIHNSTLTGMAGAVTTYLVILIQFLL
ncbi:putative gustatory receptor 28b [Homalodisca vitripennis]|uniref:putative gustatory receptor 28b n=1 Tax=Homalodisca vitripennis TaxID=197043 RepID=UPI001EEC96C0|nr:putative gustatory receptor 28b [Homalodisca vitripennis]